MDNKNIAILGLAFKPDTDDMRFAPSIDIVHYFLKEGAHLRLYDPQAVLEAKAIFNDKRIKFVKNPYDAIKECDCVCVLTEWQEFKKLDFKRVKKSMRYPLLADGRNMFDKEAITQAGFKYIGIGS